MVTSFLWFLRILSLNSRVEEGALSAAFGLPKSPWDQSVAPAEGGNGAQGAVGARGTPFGREASPRLAISLQASAVGGRWSRGQHMACAASSLAGHIPQSAASRGREGSWRATQKSGHSHPSFSCERNKPGSHGGGSSSQLPVCTRLPPRTQTGNWGKCLERLGSSVCRGLKSSCLHFS